jgi:hypothetical protein
MGLTNIGRNRFEREVIEVNTPQLGQRAHYRPCRLQSGSTHQQAWATCEFFAFCNSPHGFNEGCLTFTQAKRVNRFRPTALAILREEAVGATKDVRCVRSQFLQLPMKPNRNFAIAWVTHKAI